MKFVGKSIRLKLAVPANIMYDRELFSVFHSIEQRTKSDIHVKIPVHDIDLLNDI